MDNVNTTAEAQVTAPVKAVKKVAKKVAVKAAPAKAVKGTKKAAGKKVVKKVVHKGTNPIKGVKAVDGDRISDKSKTPAERINLCLKALRKIGAVNANTAVNVATLAPKAGLNEFDTYGAVYKHRRLQTEGFVKQCEVDGVKGQAFYLTAKGQKTDLS